MNFGYLIDKLNKSWDVKTAYMGLWYENCPATNQCGVTAMVVQDYFGGTIIGANVYNFITDEKTYHLWNLLEDGREVDLTSAQFSNPRFLEISERKEITRMELESYPDTLKRYKLLKERRDNV